MAKKVIIIGSGLSGLSAAYELAKTNQYDITIIEKEKVFGGRTSSWNDKGMIIESGFHKFLGFYTHLPALLNGVGMKLTEVIRWEDEIEIATPDGKRADFYISPLGKPVKTLLSMLGNNHYLNLKEKLSFVRLLSIGLYKYFTKPQELDQTDIFSFSHKHGLSDSTIRKIIEPLSTGIYFLPVKEYSAFAFFSTFGAYLPSSYKFGAGGFKGGMSEVLIEPIINWLKTHGAVVLKEEEVTTLLYKNNKITGVETSKNKYEADFVVLAAPVKVAQQLLKKAFPKEVWVNDFLKLQTLAAVTVQIELREPAVKTDHAVFVPGTVLSSFSEESHTTFPRSKGRLSLILTPPDDLIKLQDKELLDLAINDLHKIGIDIKEKIIDYRTTRFYDDFYRFIPGAEKYRPIQKTPIEGLILAGDYTKQKYMTTMEGAVYSGKLAAKVIQKIN